MIRNQHAKVRAEQHASAEAMWLDRPRLRRDASRAGDNPIQRVRATLESDRLKMRERVIIAAILVMLTCVVETFWHHLFG